MPPAKQQRRPPRKTDEPPDVVDPAWLLKALGITVVAAVICAYASLCLLYYQGGWQLLLHPSHEVGTTPANAGLGYSDVRFDST